MKHFLKDRNILLIVSGGIAAYKSPTLVRAFRKVGANIRVVLTKAAESFVTPLSLQVVSENVVGRSLFDPSFESEIGHIELAKWAEVIVIAPATAHILARIRAGFADDLATTLLLATQAPIVVCPSMNTQMLAHQATQENLSVLRERGYSVVNPDVGFLACKEQGSGRLPDPPLILLSAERALHSKPLLGRTVTISAGPTREYLDPVRFLSNPSSGKMGTALAEAAWVAGAKVTFIHGTICKLPASPSEKVPFVSTNELQKALHKHAKDILIMAAAVSDYRPVQIHEQKQKKQAGDLSLELTRNPDLLIILTHGEQPPNVVIGFAAETENLVQNATGKLERKKLDGIVGNSVAGKKGAFNSDTNRVVLLDRTGSTWLEEASKRSIADRIIDWIVTLTQDQS